MRGHLVLTGIGHNSSFSVADFPGHVIRMHSDEDNLFDIEYTVSQFYAPNIKRFVKVWDNDLIPCLIITYPPSYSPSVKIPSHLTMSLLSLTTDPRTDLLTSSHVSANCFVSALSLSKQQILALSRYELAITNAVLI